MLLCVVVVEPVESRAAVLIPQFVYKVFNLKTVILKGGDIWYQLLWKYTKRALSKVFFPQGFQEVDIIHPEASLTQICTYRIVLNLPRPVLCKLQLTFISTRRQILGLWCFWVHLKWLENESVSSRWFKKVFCYFLGIINVLFKASNLKICTR